MTTTTDVDARGQLAAAELRSAVADIRVPATTPHPAPRKRRVTFAFAALLVLSAVIVAVAVRDEAPTKLTTGVPTALPRFVPTYMPDGSALYRTVSSTPPDLRLTTAVFSSTPRPVRGRGELMVNVRTLDGGFDPDIGDGTSASVRGHAARTQEYSIDNGETLRVLWWLENANTWVDVQSATMDGEALLAAAEELQVVDGAVANQDVGGLSVLSRRSSDDQRETRTLRLRTGQPEQFLYITTTRVTATDIVDWLPGKEVDVRGHKAWMSHQPLGGSETRGLVVTISWSPSPDIRVSVLASAFADDEVLRMARSMRDVSESEWDALPTQ